MEQLPPRNIYFATHPSKQAHILNSDRNLKDSNPFVSILIKDAILLSDLSPMCIKRFNMKIKSSRNEKLIQGVCAGSSIYAIHLILHSLITVNIWNPSLVKKKC